jgi:hypothetical protein
MEERHKIGVRGVRKTDQHTQRAPGSKATTRRRTARCPLLFIVVGSTNLLT